MFHEGKSLMIAMYRLALASIVSTSCLAQEPPWIVNPELIMYPGCTPTSQVCKVKSITMTINTDGFNNNGFYKCDMPQDRDGLFTLDVMQIYNNPSRPPGGYKNVLSVVVPRDLDPNTYCIQDHVRHGLVPKYITYQLDDIDPSNTFEMYPAKYGMKMGFVFTYGAPNTWNMRQQTYAADVPVDPTPPVCTINERGPIDFAHGSVARGDGPGSDVVSHDISVSCLAPSTIRLEIVGGTDLPTTLPGVNSTISFDGTPYSRNYLVSGTTNINLSSTVSWKQWTEKSNVGAFTASGIVIMSIL